MCRPATDGGCDVAEVSRTSRACLAAAVRLQHVCAKDDSTLNNKAAGHLDRMLSHNVGLQNPPTQYCNGVDRECPPDGYREAGALCRAATGECDKAEVSGTGD